MVRESTSELKTCFLNISAYSSICDLAHSTKPAETSASMYAERDTYNSLLATSFSLKLARNQSAVCLIPVKTTVARSPIYEPM